MKSERDPNQISQSEHDEDYNAKRVVVVGQNLDLGLDPEQIQKTLEKAFEKIEFPKFEKPACPGCVIEPQIKEIEKPIIIEKEVIKEIEKPIIVEKVIYKEIEIPHIITREKIVEIEKPVIVEKVIEKEVLRERYVPRRQQICIIVQTIVVVCLFISHILKP